MGITIAHDHPELSNFPGVQTGQRIPKSSLFTETGV